MESEFFRDKTELQAPSRIIRDNILFILDVVHKNRQYINKHFQNSMSNYFLRNFLFSLLSPFKKYKNENKMNMAINIKYKNTEGANYMRLINGYVKELIRYDLLSQYRQMLSEAILKKNVEYSHDQLRVSNDFQAQAWRKGFCLFLLYHSYKRSIKGIFEMWSSLFPEAKIVRLRKENTNHKIFVPDWSQKGAQGIENPSDQEDEQLNSRQNEVQREQLNNKNPSDEDEQELNSGENGDQIERSEESSSDQDKEELNSGENEQEEGKRGKRSSGQDQKELNQVQKELQGGSRIEGASTQNEEELNLRQKAQQERQQSIEIPSNQIEQELNSMQNLFLGKQSIDNPFIQQELELNSKRNELLGKQQGQKDSFYQEELEFQSRQNEYYDFHSNIAQPSAQIYPENSQSKIKESIEQEKLSSSSSSSFSTLLEKRLFDNNNSESLIKKTPSKSTLSNNSTSNRNFNIEKQDKNPKIRDSPKSIDKKKGIEKIKSKRNKSNRYNSSKITQINGYSSQLKRCEVKEISSSSPQSINQYSLSTFIRQNSLEGKPEIPAPQRKSSLEIKRIFSP